MDETWRIELLGGLRAQCGGAVGTAPGLVISRFQMQKAGALLAYLAYYRHPCCPREELIEVLWPQLDPEAGRNNLRVVLHSLRRQLARPGTPADALLVADRHHVGLRPGAVTTDVQEFLDALPGAARTASPGERAQRLSRAVALYAGELLPGAGEEWVLTERPHLAERHQEALHQLALLLEQAGNLEAAIDTARRAVSADPLREEAHFDLMRLYAAAGEPSATLRQYQELERLLRDQLDETPTAATRALAEELRRNARMLVVARAAQPAALALSAPAHAPPAPPASPLTAPGLPTQLTRCFGREREIAAICELLGALHHGDAEDTDAPPQGSRLVTLTGPGGSGKTRLAIAAAGRLTAPFNGAVAFVPLADVTEPERIVGAVTGALGLLRAPHANSRAELVEALRQRPWLLVLDNMEHLVEEGALLVRELLERAPALTCLVTSRQRLEIAGEQEFSVMPLPTPPRSASPAQLLAYPSVQLFVDRARAVRREFAVTQANAAAVGELCDRLEGLPLALELAAAWAQTLTPEQMLERLSDRFELLVSRRRDPSPRHRSLRTAMEWSHQRLSPELRQFFARLSVFRGGWTLEAAEQVAALPTADDRPSTASTTGETASRLADVPGDRRSAVSGPSSVLEALRQLEECSLVVAAESGAAMRYRLLETLREFAAEQLEPAERNALAERHARFFLALAAEAEDAEEGADRRAWLECLEREHDNLRAALDWSRTPPGDPELGLMLGSALAWFWLGRGHLVEGGKRVVGLLEAAGWTSRAGLSPAALRTRAKALGRAGQLTYLQGDFEAACPLLEASLSLARELDDRALLAHVLCRLAIVRRAPHVKLELYEESLSLYRELRDERNVASTRVWLGLACQRYDPERARGLFHEALTAFRRLNDVIHLAWALVHLGNVVSLQGDYAAARGGIEEALALFRALDDPMGIACCHNFLGRDALLGGRTEEAERLHREALRLSREVGSQPDVAVSLCALGNVALARGDPDAAGACFEEALAIFPVREERPDCIEALDGLGRVAERHGERDRATAQFAECLALAQEWNHPVLVMTSLERLACVAAATGEPERGARLLGGVAAQREALGVPRPPHEQPEHDRHVASVRACLGEAAFAAAWAAGRQMGPEQAVAEALARAGPSHSG